MTKKNTLNLFAPLSVCMVVITLGAAFGVLSGRGAFMGMVSACLITLITALVGGSRYGVSSPTGPMTAGISAILLLDQKWLQNHGSEIDLVSLSNITLFLAGIFLFLMVIFKVHKLIKWIPNLVISGFVNGIAILIIFAQFRSMQATADWVLMGVTFLFSLFVSHINRRLTHLAWRILSSSFLVIALVSLFCWLFKAPVSYVDLGTTSFSLNLALPDFQLLRGETFNIVFLLALELALIALLDTLLTAVIMDKKSGKKTRMTQELSGQSLSLMGVSLIGGIPGAQSTVPSMMLFQEKGHHRFSKLILALGCLLFTFILAELLQFIPLAVFGGLILKIALDVMDIKSLKSLYHCKKNFFRLLMIIGTTLTTVFVSLNLAVIFFTSLFIFWNKLISPKWHIIDLKADESEGVNDEV